ncbi:DUF4913 domain-containing protein [Nocardiopsis alba]|uniref:DUF4913 domain-containing protein n=1 Tax=Nocardiopsis alba TaxID=53437 RepID=UPI0033B6D2F2
MTVDPYEARIARLEQQVAELADELLALMAKASGATVSGRSADTPCAWVEMPPDIAREHLERLQDWMSRVLVHHPRVVSVLHPCWYRHPAAVQMLLDVRRSWEYAYRHNPETPHLAIAWWQQDLPNLEHALARELNHCTGVRHDPDRIPVPLVDPAQAHRHLSQRAPHPRP